MKVATFARLQTMQSVTKCTDSQFSPGDNGREAFDWIVADGPQESDNLKRKFSAKRNIEATI